MEWNWYRNGNNVTPFLLYESCGDSEEIRSDIHHHHHEDLEAAMDDSEGVFSFRFDEDVDVDDVVVDDDDDDDDAQSCSYDHSSYINRSYGSSSHQSQRLIYVDDDAGDIHQDDDDDDDGDIYDDNKNWGESKLMDSCKQQKRSQKCCVDSSNQGEIDRKFWEACFAS